jgi:hypothetical protein
MNADFVFSVSVQLRWRQVIPCLPSFSQCTVHQYIEYDYVNTQYIRHAALRKLSKVINLTLFG